MHTQYAMYMKYTNSSIPVIKYTYELEHVVVVVEVAVVVIARLNPANLSIGFLIVRKHLTAAEDSSIVASTSTSRMITRLVDRVAG